MLQIAMSSLFAQNNSPQISPIDTQKIEEFTVKLRPGSKNTYFFDVYKKGKETPIQPNYPMALTVNGYNSKAAAFKAAALLIEKFQITGEFPPINAPNF